jgi:hypothetical protein
MVMAMMQLCVLVPAARWRFGRREGVSQLIGSMELRLLPVGPTFDQLSV